MNSAMSSETRSDGSLTTCIEIDSKSSHEIEDANTCSESFELVSHDKTVGYQDTEDFMIPTHISCQNSMSTLCTEGFIEVAPFENNKTSSQNHSEKSVEIRLCCEGTSIDNNVSDEGAKKALDIGNTLDSYSKDSAMMSCSYDSQVKTNINVGSTPQRTKVSGIIIETSRNMPDSVPVPNNDEPDIKRLDTYSAHIEDNYLQLLVQEQRLEYHEMRDGDEDCSLALCQAILKDSQPNEHNNSGSFRTNTCSYKDIGLCTASCLDELMNCQGTDCKGKLHTICQVQYESLFDIPDFTKKGLCRYCLPEHFV